MSYLERASFIVGTVLVGISAALVIAQRRGLGQGRREKRPPVEKLADDLKHAWAAYHTP